jgi:hypothetical protein
MTSRNRIFALVTVPICISTLVVGALFAGAGDLNPPVGPVAPTHKTLTEVEPRIAINATNTPGDADSLFKITQPGSYYLIGNITGVAAKHGVKITASGVTLDLHGFDLLGVAGSLSGVSVSPAFPVLTNIAVANGSVRGWGQIGVDVANAQNTRVSDLLADANTAFGISAGVNAVVTQCSAHLNTNTGIRTTNGCTITRCSAVSNTGFGITTNGGSTITDCVAAFNVGGGISMSDGCAVINCSVFENDSDGIRVATDCTVRGNTCDLNGNTGDGAGIHASGTDNRIESNNCTRADRGIDVDVAGNFITRNTCSGNATNWDVVAGNVCLVVQGVTGGAILGNTGGAGPGSTDPNANFTY